MIEKIFRTGIIQNFQIALVVYIIFGILIFATVLFFIIGKINPHANIKEIKTRINSWWVIAIGFLLVILFNRSIAFIALAMISFVAFRELYSLLNFRESDRRAILWAFVSIPIQYYLAYIAWYGAFIILIPVGMFLFIPFRMVVKGDTQGILKSMATIQWILMLTVFGLSHMAYLLSLPELPNFKAGGLGLLMFLVFVTQLNDVMQFTWGKLLGKHKIIPKVSPNKTWEGFIGGLISTIFIGYGLSFLLPLSKPYVILVSASIAISGFIGDVVMSSIKRDIGVKDTGNFIPGHGGILDRLDSLCYTSPVFFHIVYYLAY